MIINNRVETQSRFAQFIRERAYLNNVSPLTLEWHRKSPRWLGTETPNSKWSLAEECLQAIGEQPSSWLPEPTVKLRWERRDDRRKKSAFSVLPSPNRAFPSRDTSCISCRFHRDTGRFWRGFPLFLPRVSIRLRREEVRLHETRRVVGTLTHMQNITCDASNFFLRF